PPLACGPPNESGRGDWWPDEYCLQPAEGAGDAGRRYDGEEAGPAAAAGGVRRAVPAAADAVRHLRGVAARRRTGRPAAAEHATAERHVRHHQAEQPGGPAARPAGATGEAG